MRAKREKMRAKRENSPSFSLIILQQGENKRFSQQNDVKISVFAYVFLVCFFSFSLFGLFTIFLDCLSFFSITYIEIH